MTKLQTPRSCRYSVEELPYDWRERRNEDPQQKHCFNYVNLRKPRKIYWQRWIRATGNYAEKMCWAYICDLCSEMLREDSEFDWEGWPQGEDGKYIGSIECSLP